MNETYCKIVLVLSQFGLLTLDFVDKYPEMSHLLKKLAFTEVYIGVTNYQITILLFVEMNGFQNGYESQIESI